MDSENNLNQGNPGERSIRLLRPSIVVLCGPAGCGKSTFAARHFRPTQIISSDWARAWVADDDRDQRYNAQAFALVHFLIEQRVMVNRLCVVDSTALTAQARKGLLELARKHQVPSTLLLFNVPLETCIERDEKRERSVGRLVIERQYQAYEQSKDAIRQEAFGQIVGLGVADLEKVQIEILFRPIVRQSPRPPRPEAGPARRFDHSPQALKPRPDGPGGVVPAVAVSPPVPPITPAPQLTPARRPLATSGAANPSAGTQAGFASDRASASVSKSPAPPAGTDKPAVAPHPTGPALPRLEMEVARKV